ncbi:MAG: hypothetical protein ACYCRE_04140 [Acidobacteriaceae bacterium]
MDWFTWLFRSYELFSARKNGTSNLQRIERAQSALASFFHRAFQERLARRYPARSRLEKRFVKLYFFRPLIKNCLRQNFETNVIAGNVFAVLIDEKRESKGSRIDCSLCCENKDA